MTQRRHQSTSLLLFLLCLAPGAAHVIACSASNGDAIPAEVRDASSIDAGNTGEPDDASSSSSGGDGGGKKDSGSPKDSGGDKDVGPDGSSSGGPVIVINEVYVDHDSLGDVAEFVELRGDPGVVIDDLKLRLVNHLGTVTHTVDIGPAGAKFPASGLWVVGGGQTFQTSSPSHEDQTQTLASGWGLDNERGAVQLVRGTTLLDVVGWSDGPDAGTLSVVGAPPLAGGEGSAAAVPTISRPSTPPKIAHSLGRRAASADTNDNATDFCSMPATPGYPQKPCD